MSADVLVERLRVALELADAGVDLMRQNLRRAHPDLSDHEIDGLLLGWLDSRTGTGGGDCSGSRRVLTDR